MTTEFKLKLKGEDRTENGLAYFKCKNTIASWRMVNGRNWWQKIIMTATWNIIATDYTSYSIVYVPRNLLLWKPVIFIYSREQNVTEDVMESWINQAVKLTGYGREFFRKAYRSNEYM